jgi:EAL and modified HD-GYP domain-containing signal transduction protein
MQILVARQPIFDRKEGLYGYDLILRRPDGSTIGGDVPAERLVVDTFLGIGIDQVAAGHRAFVTIDRDMLLSGAVRLLPAERVVLQIAGKLTPESDILAACGDLVASGYSFAIDSQTPESLSDEALSLAHIVKVDISTTAPELLPDLATWLQSRKARLLAVHVRHRAERDVCRDLGFEFFEGHGSSAPETLARRDLPIEHMATFRLLKMVRDPKATDNEIEEVLKHDVALSYKLLRMVNSASVGGRNIWSIGHALRMLGRDPIARWLGMLLVTDTKNMDAARSELIHLALFRARMCELLAEAASVPRAKGPLFLVGMFSVLDRLLEVPMEQLVDSMEFAPDVRFALLSRADFYGATLNLVEAYERGEWDNVDAFAESLAIGTVTLPPVYLAALSWATEQRASTREAA